MVEPDLRPEPEGTNDAAAWVRNGEPKIKHPPFLERGDQAVSHRKHER